MPTLKLTALLEATRGRLVQGDRKAVFTSGSIDTRSLRKGAAFFALPGKTTDGHEFLDEAASRGAVLAVVQHEVEVDRAWSMAVVRVGDVADALGRAGTLARRHVSARVAVVTGSTGKTTTKEFLAAGLAATHRVHRTPGNWNNHLGVPLTLLACPDNAEYQVVEIGMSAPGEVAALTRMADPDIGLVTNVHPVHLEFFRSVDDIAAAKGEMFAAMRSEATAVANLDDEWIRVQAARHDGPQVSFGRRTSADLVMERVEDRFLPGASFAFRHRGTSRTVQLRVGGAHAARNALAALAGIVAAGESLDAAVEAIQKVEAGPGRGRILRLTGGVLVVDDTYNSNPTAMEAVLETLKGSRPSGRKVLVMGEMLELGPRGDRLHAQVGRHAGAAGVRLMAGVGSKTRSALEEARRSGVEETRFFRAAADAARELPELIRPGDLVVVKGSRAVHLEKVVGSLVECLRQEVA